MLGMDLNMPVTLVVKAPNQKFGDLTVECALGWTIRKLKEHLATVYPNKPVSRLNVYSASIINFLMKIWPRVYKLRKRPVYLIF